MTPRHPEAPPAAAAAPTCCCDTTETQRAVAGAAPSAQPCPSCVAALVAEPDRFTALREAVAAEAEPLIVLTVLLRWCRDHHRQLQALMTDGPVQTALEARVDPVRRTMVGTRDRSSLDDTVRGELATLFARDDDVPVVAMAHRVAELIDEQYQVSLSASFRARSPYRPGVGDPVPLGAANVTAVTTLVPTAPPWRLAHRLDQTRHVRLAGEWAAQFHVVFDYSLAETGAPFLGADTVLATVHPNASLADLEFPAGPDGRVFHIGPADERRQGAQLDALIGTAVDQGATIVVLPELALTPALAQRLRHWVTDAAGPNVLVAGSVHTPEADGTRRNRAFTWVRGLAHPLVHDKFSPADRPVTEGVDADPYPQIRVHVGTDGWHAVVLVCRDLLNRDAVHVPHRGRRQPRPRACHERDTHRLRRPGRPARRCEPGLCGRRQQPRRMAGRHPRRGLAPPGQGRVRSPRIRAATAPGQWRRARTRCRHAAAGLRSNPVAPRPQRGPPTQTRLDPAHAGLGGTGRCRDPGSGGQWIPAARAPTRVKIQVAPEPSENAAPGL